jgi:hypothetical protein
VPAWPAPGAQVIEVEDADAAVVAVAGLARSGTVFANSRARDRNAAEVLTARSVHDCAAGGVGRLAQRSGLPIRACRRAIGQTIATTGRSSTRMAKAGRRRWVESPSS